MGTWNVFLHIPFNVVKCFLVARRLPRYQCCVRQGAAIALPFAERRGQRLQKGLGREEGPLWVATRTPGVPGPPASMTAS